LEGLHYAHQRGVIHRDVKPSNVRITSDGRAKIMDFGIARLQSGDVEGSGAIVGTPTYMAPEQITNGAISPATDVFAVGCLLYELLAYKKPFEAETVHGVLYQVLTADPKPLRTLAPSTPAALERVVMKAINKVREDRYESAEQMQHTLIGIRAALSGANTTERMGLRWTPIPGPLLKLVTHTPMRWRATVLSALALVVAVLVYLPGPSDQVEAVPTPPGTVAIAPMPATLNPALAALRDSAWGARAQAEAAGAIKSGLGSAVVGEGLLLAADRQAQSGDVSHAAPGWREAVMRFRLAAREAAQEREAVATQIERATPVVQALGTRPEAAGAAASLARAESLLTANDFNLARLAAQNAEQVGIAAGIAPPSPQPSESRAAVQVLLEDLARAVASERVANLRPLYPTISDAELGNWERFFASANDLRATFQVEGFAVSGGTAQVDVQAHYRYIDTADARLREVFPKLQMALRRTANGWRVTGVTELREVRRPR
ncbi:MAG TPA: serine/threonine-protein kinase, partial [Gemmatimonadales bacterium]